MDNQSSQEPRSDPPEQPEAETGPPAPPAAAETPMPAAADPAPTPEPTPGPRRRRRWLSAAGAHLPLLIPLAVLIILRWLLVHPDPTDYPLDRNITMALRMQVMRRDIRELDLRLERNKNQLARVSSATPEFPFIPIGSWLLGRFGVDVVVAARLMSLAAAIATGLGIYLLGARIGPLATAQVALWLYALLPLAVLMGRSMLPDTLMVAAIVWAMAAAGAGRGRVNLAMALPMGVLLLLAGLAKLPAVFFAPAAAWIYLAAAGWRRPTAWITLVFITLMVYAGICGWYRIDPRDPLVGLERISRGTNDALASAAEVLTAEAMMVMLGRVVLALTLPGALLLLFAWVFLQGRPGHRAWLNLWLVVSLAFVLITVKANSYWAYAVVPVACLTIGAGLARLWRAGRWMLVPLALVAAAAGVIDPGREQIRAYLATRPAYQVAGREVPGLAKRGRLLYDGQVPDDLFFFVRRPGQSLQNRARQAAESMLNSDYYQYFLTTDVAGSALTDWQFDTRPLIRFHPAAYALFQMGRATTIGESVAADEITSGAALNLHDRLLVLEATVDPARPEPGRHMELSVVFQKGPEFHPGLILAGRLLHEPSGEELPLIAEAGGADFWTWRQPQLQVPEFAVTDVMRVRYDIRALPHLPAGPYDLILQLLRDRRQHAPDGEAIRVPLDLELRPVQPKLPLTIDVEDVLWRRRQAVVGPAWRGKPVVRWRLGSESDVWIAPGLPPGRYDLTVTAAGEPAGAEPGDRRWPVLGVKQPGRSEQTLRFDSRRPRTLHLRFELRGPEDFLHLSLNNPRYDDSPRVALPLYLIDFARGDRALLIESIQIDLAAQP